jgi:hypothetical protein
MNRFGGLIFLVGLVIVGLSVFAEDLGITGESAGGFGWKQSVGVGVGALLVVIGAVAWSRRDRPA